VKKAIPYKKNFPNQVAFKMQTYLTKADLAQIERLSIPVDEFIKLKLRQCDAKTRTGRQCLMCAKPGSSKCTIHGGLSTGPKSEEGKKKALANLLKSHRRQGISKK